MIPLSSYKCLCAINWFKNEDVVGAVTTGDAPTTSEWSTILSLLRCTLYQRFDGTCYNHTHHLFWTLSLFRMFRWFEDIFFGRRMGTGFHLTEDLFVAGRNQNSIFKETTFWPGGYNTEIYYLPSAHTSYINRLMPEQNGWHFLQWKSWNFDSNFIVFCS